MRGRRTFLEGWRRIGLTAGMVLIGLAAQTAAAEERYRFADEASLSEAMAALNRALNHDAKPGNPCRLDILSDLRGHRLFDERTSDAMHRALAGAILGSGEVDGCTVRDHEVGQSEVAAFLEERRAAGELGQTLALSYYRLGEGITVFAILRDDEGGISGSTGRFDLPVTLAAGEGKAEAADETTAATEAAEPPAAPEPETTPTATAESSPEPAAPTPGAPTAERSTAERSTAGTPKAEAAPERTATSEAALRRQLAAATRTDGAPARAFNLRRVQAGVPASIKTVRIIDAGGRESALIAALADGFLGEDGAAEAIDVQRADAPDAFEDILDNEGDIVVTRAPISKADARAFAETYGVNMRSRYAEYVVAIAETDAGSLACGIRYPEDGMMMSTEDHPASERVYLYVNPSIPNAVRDSFVAFALSERGQRLVAAHAVDLRLRLGDVRYAAWRYQATGEQDAALPERQQRFRELIRTSQRVSSTFRFDFASADLVLDSRSEQDLENLIDLVKARDIDARRILLFGFADSAGAATFNADLSRNRADAVATRLRLAGIAVPPRNVHGIGEDSPVACNLQDDGDRDEAGARKNRRVEVWIDS